MIGAKFLRSKACMHTFLRLYQTVKVVLVAFGQGDSRF